VSQLDFYHALVELCPQATFTSSDVFVCCQRMQYIVNLWLAKRDRPHGHNDRVRWQNEFRDLLERIADVAGIEPQLAKDPEGGDWYGWLVDAARKLESFFPEEMRSTSKQACGNSLEKSKGRPRVAPAPIYLASD
jgi:hypothetical protein